jgi:phosphoribosyl 1,2-cyclic phosphodiesterase
MIIRLLGTRGSIPTTNPETFQYGGNTSCIEVIEKEQLLIVDAGTGILNISKDKLEKSERFDILLTHLHFDHIQGLGFFQPLFDSSREIHIWGPASCKQNLQYRLNRYLSPPLFPVHFRDLPCRISLHEVAHSSFDIGRLHIESNYISHPGPTVGYRITNGNSIFAYFPDHEPLIGKDSWNRKKEWIPGIALASRADLLIHDSQYTLEEYKSKIGWGHSTMLHALRFATLAEVKKLLLFHHDPTHTDSMLDNIYEDFIRENSIKLSLELATEGSIFDLG